MLRVLILFILTCTNCFAEYRVYQYLVKSNSNLPQDPDPYIVTSTLFPSAYLAYHGGPTALKIDLLKSWMCPGYTAFKAPHCPSPIEKMEKQELEAQVQ